MRIGTTGHPVKALSLGVVSYRLLHREHCVREFRESEQSIRGFDIAERDATQQMNHIERDEIEEPEE